MDYSLSEEQARFQQSVRDFVDREVKPEARAIDEQAVFPEQLFKQCAANGYLGLRYPETVGGMGGEFISFCLMVEQLARGSLSLASAVSMQALMGTDFLYRFGTEDHKRRLLEPALRGEKIGTIAMTEQIGFDLACNSCGDGTAQLLLEVEQVFEIGIVAFAPDLVAAGGLDQLYGYADAVDRGFTDAALDDVIDVQFLGDFADDF